MKNLAGRVAVVTGGGSGIGRAICLSLAEAGAHVAVADIEEEAARKVAEEVSGLNVRSIAVHCDVADRASVEDLAERAFAEFGAVHVLCNNAGVGAGGPLEECADEDWQWVLSVNLCGVVNGLQAFLPRMKRQDGEKHVVNTASMAGLVAFPGLGPYTATKYAVVGISETLRQEGAEWGLGVSVVCPGLVRTRILESGRNRPPAFGGPQERDPGLAAFAEDRMRTSGIDAETVGRLVREAILDNRLYVLSHPELASAFEARANEIRDAFRRAGRD